MDIEIQKIILPIIGGLIGGLIVAFFTYLFNVKKEKESEKYKMKLLLYKELLNELNDLILLDIFDLKGRNIQEVIHHDRKIINNAFSKVHLFAPIEIVKKLGFMENVISDASDENFQKKPDKWEYDFVTFEEDFLIEVWSELIDYIKELREEIRKDLNYDNISIKEISDAFIKDREVKEAKMKERMVKDNNYIESIENNK